MGGGELSGHADLLRARAADADGRAISGRGGRAGQLWAPRSGEVAGIGDRVVARCALVAISRPRSRSRAIWR